jgi:aryl-alcohol dehydrogenase-like predicted oxidoreductase
MEYRPFGRTGLEVSAIGFRCYDETMSALDDIVREGIAEVEDNAGAPSWTLSGAELAEIDAICARHEIDTEPDFWIEEVT